MPQAIQTGEFNTFVGGLVTEASPLTFPENASIDEANFILNRDGSRQRRLGMDRENGLTPYDVEYLVNPTSDIQLNAYEWKNVAGIADKTFIVCQVHSNVYVLDRADESLKSNSYVKFQRRFSDNLAYGRMSFTTIDGKLVFVFGSSPSVHSLEYTASPESIDYSQKKILIRDLFGVSESIGGKDLFSPDYINFRPDTTDPAEYHMYNLRNQGWGIPRLQWTGALKADPVSDFQDSGGDERGLPSMADTPVSTLYANTAETDKNSERFNDEASYRQEPARTRAAAGHFVIDLLSRGSSRKTQYENITNTVSGLYVNANPGAIPPDTEYITFRTPTVILPEDRTVGGASVVGEFAGRVWYGGFSNEVVGGDSQSPKLSSYIFYSQQVVHEDQIVRCYQEGDPTDVETPDRLDTDGGFIRVSGAANIKAFVNIGGALLVFADNGIWAISGSDSGTFNANNQTLTKISEHGVVSPGSIVLVDSSVMFWAEDAIYHIVPGEVGGYAVNDASTKIRDYYQSISDDSKRLSQGIYDKYEKKIKWVYDNTTGTSTTKELVFDTALPAFYPSVIGNIATSQIPAVPIQTAPFMVDIVDLEVLSELDGVDSGTDNVVVETELSVGGFSETTYLTLVNSVDINNTSLTFSTYSNDNFKDWESVDGTGVDAAAYLLTGYIGTGDNHKFKQVPYIYFHFLRTESGFTDGGDDLVVLDESSCKVRSQWDWANSAAAGKWGKEFQAYRYRRMYMPDDVSDSFDSGHRTIVSKNKLRGRGRVVSLLISTEEDKDMKLLGWSMNIASNQSV